MTVAAVGGTLARMDGDAIEVVDGGRRIAFTFDDVLRYHGPGSPGGAAIGFKALQRGVELLGVDGACERRAIVVATAFGGPGARDAFELVARSVTGDRYRVDPALARPDRGRVLERFVFRLGVGDARAVTLLLRDGFVTEEFVDLAGARARAPEEERRLATLKLALAERVMARPADEVYEVSEVAARASS
ncbi:MAG TPA: hypothetical protein VI318_26275 [Baekduia sp.]